jgi:hypothetical protein
VALQTELENGEQRLSYSRSSFQAESRSISSRKKHKPRQAPASVRKLLRLKRAAKSVWSDTQVIFCNEWQPPPTLLKHPYTYETHGLHSHHSS